MVIHSFRFFAANETLDTGRARGQSFAMIRPCSAGDIPEILTIINDGASAYRGVIPADRWHQPYMPREELEHEIAAGVEFSGWDEAGRLAGVMGLQPVKDVLLIRHAYVRTAQRQLGIGGKLLKHLVASADRRMLVGTWKAASWAVRFYEKHGFRLVGDEEKNRLLRTYWTVPDRQIETSVVLSLGD